MDARLKKLEDAANKTKSGAQLGQQGFVETMIAAGGQALKQGADNKAGFLGAIIGAVGSKDGALTGALGGALTGTGGVLHDALSGMGLGDAQIKAIGMATVSMAAGLASTALAAKSTGKSVTSALEGDLGTKALTAAESVMAAPAVKQNTGAPTTGTKNTD